MSVFDLKGPQTSISGYGGGTHKSEKFALKQGIVVAEIAHRDDGDFKLKFVTNRRRKIIRKAAVAVKAAASGQWIAAESKGPLNAWAVMRVDKKGHHKISPGQYHIDVKSQAQWHCRYIQPDLGQTIAALTETEINGGGENGASSAVIGPYTSGARPIIANVRHQGIGDFRTNACSLDGTHHCVLYRERGQFYVQNILTGIRSGKEYLLHIDAPGEWTMSFSEGY